MSGGSRRRPTSFDVAERAGVSQPTVSRALSGSPALEARFTSTAALLTRLATRPAPTPTPEPKARSKPEKPKKEKGRAPAKEARPSFLSRKKPQG